MFDLSWGHILVVAVVAIVVVGPKDLPRMLRAFGQTVAKMRRMAGEFQSQFNEALREAELEDVKRSIESIRDLNPARQIRDAISQSLDEIDRAPPTLPAASATPAPVVDAVPSAPALAPAEPFDEAPLPRQAQSAPVEAEPVATTRSEPAAHTTEPEKQRAEP